MKKQSLMLFIVLILGFASCGGNDNDDINVGNNPNEQIVTGGGEQISYDYTTSSLSYSTTSNVYVKAHLYGYANLSPEQMTLLGVGGISFGIISGFDESVMYNDVKATAIDNNNQFTITSEMGVFSAPLPDKVFFQAYIEIGGVRQYGRVRTLPLNTPSEEDLLKKKNQENGTFGTFDLSKQTEYNLGGYASPSDFIIINSDYINAYMGRNCTFVGIASASDKHKLTQENLDNTYTEANKTTRTFTQNYSSNTEKVYYGECNIYISKDLYKGRVFKNDYPSGGTLYYCSMMEVPYYDNLFSRTPIGTRTRMGEIKSTSW